MQWPNGRNLLNGGLSRANNRHLILLVMPPAQTEVSDIRIYPVKSTLPFFRNQSRVTVLGLEFDRRIVLVDSDRAVITGRSNVNPLRIRTTISDKGLTVHLPDERAFTFKPESHLDQVTEIRHFGKWIAGYPIKHEVNLALSKVLGEEARLVFMTDSIARPMKEKDGAQNNERVSYADSAPVHLISEASLEDLNTRLKEPVTIDRFRPNIIVQGCGPYEEDTWKEIRINDAHFAVSDSCKRCVFTTLDPITLHRDPEQEPLSTLSGYRANENGGIAFGIHLIPLKEGVIRKGDSIDIIA